MFNFTLLGACVMLVRGAVQISSDDDDDDGWIQSFSKNWCPTVHKGSIKF